MTKEKLAIKLAIDIMERNVSKYINHGIYEVSDTDGAVHVEFAETINILNEMLEQQPCEDAISRQEVIDSIRNYFHDEYYQRTSIQDCRDCFIEDVIKSLPPVTQQPKMERCKDCRWWKDSDGAYRRGVGAESRCPINHREVYAGNGYCFMFEPQESEDNE